MDKELHKFMDVDYSKACGRTEKDGYIAFYHEDRLYSVRNIKSGIVSLVYARNPYKAIERVKKDGMSREYSHYFKKSNSLEKQNNSDDINANITPTTARNLIELVTKLARHCVFTKLEAMLIAGICDSAIDRTLESEDQHEAEKTD